MKAEIVLTVAESKRLVARGVAQLDSIKKRMREGMIVLCNGSTNAYIYEELMGERIEKRRYITGGMAPSHVGRSWRVKPQKSLVLVDGVPDPTLDRFSALEEMERGDIYIKGANALNYRKGVAGITIGSPTGGTIGRALGPIIGKKLDLLIPVGLEKEVPFDLEEAGRLCSEPDEHLGKVFSLWPVRGHIYTEIEALKTLCNVDSVPVAAGGLAGAEGGVRLLLMGEDEAVQKAVDLVKEVQGEPPVISKEEMAQKAG
ncbi:MAG: hypothetical protein ACLFV5_08965 [Anaerolineales bacterium]